MEKGTCKSKNPLCQNGLRDLATLSGGKAPRWDTAVAHFAQDPDISDLKCELGGVECMSAPVCLSCNGPGSFAMLKSLETMYDTLENLYLSLAEARSRASNQMTLFQGIFAPVPNIKDDAIILGVVLGVIMGLVGVFVPGGQVLVATMGITITAGSLAMGIGMMSVAVASSVAMDEFFFSQPSPPDAGNILGMIVNQTMNAYSQVANSLFSGGNYTLASADGKHVTEVTMLDLMKGGALMQAPANKTTFFQHLVPNYERVMYQQLAVYTWQYLETDHVKHVPFIAFDNKPCDQITADSPTEGSIASVIHGVRKSDTNITFDGGCYYLLDGKPKGSPVIDAPPILPHCRGTDALPGGTNKAMTENSEAFGGLSLADFIIPSVKGWRQNKKQNDYARASDNGKLVSDPQDAAAVNIPVCDYVGNPKNAGVECPKLNIRCARAHCDTWSPSTGKNQPGDFNPGSCGVHVQQWLMNKGNDVNPLPNYQLSVRINDGHGIQIGQATKQSAATTLDVIDSVLPYDLFVATGAKDLDPIQFWYADQWWNSSSPPNKCKVGSYDGESRNMDW